MSFYEIWWHNIRCAAIVFACFGILALAGALTSVVCGVFDLDPVVTWILSGLAGGIVGVTLISVREWRARRKSAEIEAYLSMAFNKAK